MERREASSEQSYQFSTNKEAYALTGRSSIKCVRCELHNDSTRCHGTLIVLEREKAEKTSVEWVIGASSRVSNVLEIFHNAAVPESH